jgi:competence protein ComEA
MKKMIINKKNIIVGITGLLIFAAGICYCISMSGCSNEPKMSVALSNNVSTTEGKEDGRGESTPVPSAPITEAPKQKEEIYAHICGAVVSPGVYRTVSGARVCDLIELAGGLSENAAGDYINQAEPVADGQRVYIPNKKETENLTASELMSGNDKADEEAGDASGLVNINTADAESLMTLPGIGQAKANSIISYRNTNGNFKAIEDLMNIPGIKEGVFNQISANITVK